MKLVDQYAGACDFQCNVYDNNAQTDEIANSIKTLFKCMKFDFPTIKKTSNEQQCRNWSNKWQQDSSRFIHKKYNANPRINPIKTYSIYTMRHMCYAYYKQLVPLMRQCKANRFQSLCIHSFLLEHKDAMPFCTVTHIFWHQTTYNKYTSAHKFY